MPVDLSNLVMNVGRRSAEESAKAKVADVISFIEAPWGLGMLLFPVQRVILKAHYGLALDDNKEGFDLEKPIPEDHPRYHELIDTKPRAAVIRMELVDASEVPDDFAFGLRDHEGNDYILQNNTHWFVHDSEIETLDSIVEAINTHAGDVFEAEAFYGTLQVEVRSKAFSDAGNACRLELSSADGIMITLPEMDIYQDGYEPDAHNFYGGGGGYYKNRVVISDWRRENRRVMTEAEYLRYLHNDKRCNIAEVIPGKERREMILSIGRRSGKTTISACIAAYETYKLILKGHPQEYFGLPDSNIIQIISVATDKDQAGLLYREVQGHFLNCFAGDTEVITDEGIKPIGELAGGIHRILTRDGSWVEAPFRSFGKQRLYKLTLTRQGVDKVVWTTADHRWFAQDARKAYRGNGFQVFRTSELRPGKHHLQQVYGRSYKGVVKPSPFGIAHGFTFGDGSTVGSHRHANHVRLIGDKDAHLAPYFSMCPFHERPEVNGIEFTALPNFFRELPSILENKAYLLGWLAGYFAADGTVSKNGQVHISSSVRENLDFVRDVCAVLGIGTYGVREDTRESNLTGEPFTMYRIGLQRRCLDESFFLISQHRDNFVAAGGSEVKRVEKWTVKSVEETDRVDEVFCATVEGHGTFTLADNIVTGNCDYFAPYMANTTQSFATFQTPNDIERYGSYQDNPKARFSVKVTFRSCVAKGLRGAGNIVVILDEVAHFTDKGQSGAAEVYNAVTPSTSAFSRKDPDDSRKPIGPVEGRIILISSPLGKQGQFYRLFQIGMSGGKKSENMLCIQAPTWEVNPTVPATEFAKHYAKDVRVFMTEYGGEFTDQTGSWIEDPKDLLACVDPNLRPKIKAAPRMPHFAGLDYALVGDYSAIAIGHKEPDGTIVLDLVERIRAGEGKYAHKERLDVDDVADWVADLAKRFYITQAMSDQAFGIPIQQALEKRGLGQFEAVHHTRALNSQMFSNFKDMMYDERIRLYDWPLPEDGSDAHSPLIREFMELQGTVHSKHLMTVEAPNREGAHDDQADAVVRMVWLATNHKAKIIGFAGDVSSRVSQVSSRVMVQARARARMSGSVEARQVRKKGSAGWGR